MNNYRVLTNLISADTCTLVLSDTFLRKIEELGADSLITLGDESVDSTWGYSHKENGISLGRIRSDVPLSPFLFILLDTLVNTILLNEETALEPVVLREG